MKKQEIIEIKTDQIPDREDYLNVTASIKDKLIINIYRIDTLEIQIEVGEKIICKEISSHYKYSHEVYIRDYVPAWFYSTQFRFIDGADQIIEQYTNIPLKYGAEIFFKLLNKKYCDGELAYLKALKEEEKRERIFSKLPDEPEDILEYATKTVLKDSAYLISTQNSQKKTYRDFYCTSCYNTFTDKPKSRGTIVKCPHCGTMGEVKYHRFSKLDSSQFAVFQESTDGEGFFVRYYLCRRNYLTSYRDVKTELCELGRYYFAPGIAKQWTRTEHCQSTQNQYFTDRETWYKRGMFFFCCANYYGGFSACQDVILKVFPHCEIKQYRERLTKWSIYLENILCYIAKYARSPQLEYFIKLKLDTFVKEYIHREGSRINWRGKSLESLFGLPRDIIKSYIFTHKINDSDGLVFAKFLFKQGQFSNDNIELMNKMRSILGSLQWKQFVEQFKDQDIIRTMKYLFAQQNKEERYTKQKVSLYFKVIEYRDYLNMAKLLNFNLNSDYFRYPKYLKKAHDDVQKLIQIQKNKMLEEGIRKQAKKLSKFTFKYNGLIIRPAASSREIEQEGNIQDICIANYITRYSNGETGLFFIRRCSAPKTPYFAVEIQHGVVRQVRGKNNYAPTKEIEEFMSEFEAEKLNKKKSSKRKTENRIRVAV